MTLSTVPVDSYFLHEDKVYYKSMRASVLKCRPSENEVFANIDDDPEVEVISGEQAYKELKKVEKSL